MTRNEWMARFRARLESHGLDDDLIRASVDATSGAIADNPEVMEESPEDAADGEWQLMGDDGGCDDGE